MLSHWWTSLKYRLVRERFSKNTKDHIWRRRQSTAMRMMRNSRNRSLQWDGNSKEYTLATHKFSASSWISPRMILLLFTTDCWLRKDSLLNFYLSNRMRTNLHISYSEQLTRRTCGEALPSGCVSTIRQSKKYIKCSIFGIWVSTI